MTFEQNVLKGLVRCGLDLDSISSKSPLGIAVSGGADSVALLLSLVALFDSEKLRVITPQGHQGEEHAHRHRDAGSQAVDAVGDVHGVHRSHDDKDA